MAKKRKNAAKQSGGFLSKFSTIATIISSIVSLLFLLLFVALLLPLILSKVQTVGSNVALIELEGVITSNGAAGFATQGVSSQDFIELLQEADEDEDIKAIVITINSPGGTPVATEEIANKIKSIDKPVITVMRETAASGGYWVASATDKIYASRLTITGSIGVLASFIDVSGFMDNKNITYNRIVGGKYKDAGSPFKPLTPDERVLFEKIIDRTHSIFIDEVAANRNMPRADVEELANGFVYLGIEAQQLGLVDEIGDVDDAYEYIEGIIGEEVKPIVIANPPTFFEALSRTAAEPAFYIGQGIGSVLFEQKASSVPTVWT